jgi:hypothetical protein
MGSSWIGDETANPGLARENWNQMKEHLLSTHHLSTWVHIHSMALTLLEIRLYKEIQSIVTTSSHSDSE